MRIRSGGTRGATSPRIDAVPRDTNPAAVHHKRVDLPALFDELAAHAPHLDGAACRHHPQIFDDTVPDIANRPRAAAARREALTICREQCPCLAQCAAWLDSLDPDQRPRGVIAGRINQHHPPTPVDVFDSVRKDRSYW